MKIDSDAWRQTIIDGASALGLTVGADQALAMGRHAMELLQWNQITNLTTITEPEDVALKHYVDAMAAAAWIDDGARVLDVGSGGGFPGIPLTILRPDLSIVLVDSVRKKVSFLKHAIRTLGLSGIRAVHGRLEELRLMPEFRGRFDRVVCRAFSSLDVFADLTLPFLAPGGSLLAMKGPQANHACDNETIEDDGPIVLGGTSFWMRIHRYRLPQLDARRRLVMLRPLGKAEANGWLF